MSRRGENLGECQILEKQKLGLFKIPPKCSLHFFLSLFIVALAVPTKMVFYIRDRLFVFRASNKVLMPSIQPVLMFEHVLGSWFLACNVRILRIGTVV